MLTATNLSRRYGNLHVVQDVSMGIKAGEMVAITGPSGAGKSTLLHLLGALDVPDTGSVRIRDTDIFRLKPAAQAAFRNREIGFVFQAHHLLPEFTAAENVAMPLWIGGTGRAEGMKAAGEMLARVGLAGRLKHKPAQLSGGEQQRVAIARALIHKPALLMADEPTGNLDTANADAIHQLFRSLSSEQGQTIILVTHSEALAAIADRIVHMRDGRVVDSLVS